MKIELIKKRGRIGYKDSWEYKITDSNYEEKVLVAKSFSSPQENERYLEEWQREENEDEIWRKELYSGVAFRHTHDELALMCYELYQRTKFSDSNEELGLERVPYQRNEEEFARLKKEMELKREEIIRDEEYLEITEVIRDLFEEERFSRQEETSQPPTTSNDPSLFTIGLSLLILGIFGLALFWFNNWTNKD